MSKLISMEEILKTEKPKLRKYNPNFIVIIKEVIQAALYHKVITKIGENYRRNGNIYYRVNTLNNVVLMNVKNDYFVVTNEIVFYKGKPINLVPILLRMSFRISKIRDKENNNRERIKTNINNLGNESSEFLERIIRSVIENGHLIKLPSSWHVHHKFKTWDHRVETTQYLHKSNHTERDSHLEGRNVSNINELRNLIDELAYIILK